MIISWLAILSGCDLRAGADETTSRLGDETTTQPSQTHRARCRAKLYQQTTLIFQTSAMKWLGSGIEDAIWLTFS